MRKIVALVLIVLLAVFMTACGDQPKYSQVGPAPEITERPPETETEPEYPTVDEDNTSQSEIPMDENQVPSEDVTPSKPSGSTNNRYPSSSGNSSQTKPNKQEPSTEEPSTEEPNTEEPSTEEPSTQEPVTDEPSTEVPEEPTSDDQGFMG